MENKSVENTFDEIEKFRTLASLVQKLVQKDPPILKYDPGSDLSKKCLSDLNRISDPSQIHNILFLKDPDSD